MGFLIELRSGWSMDPSSIVNSLDAELHLQKMKATLLGFHIEAIPFLEVSLEWQEYIATKYNHASHVDYTQNIYGKTEHSHHTGFLNGIATSGLHVHFSRWSIEEESYVPFTIAETTKIVRNMDESFSELIASTGRIKGEWEPKPIHGGFEYRSLPCTARTLEVTRKALELVRDI